MRLLPEGIWRAGIFEDDDRLCRLEISGTCVRATIEGVMLIV